MKYIDTHTHLSDKAFDNDRKDIISESINKGLDFFFEVLCSPNDFDKFKSFAVYMDNFYFSFGIHPEYADENSPENFKLLKQFLLKDRSVFIGEIGLDYYWVNDNKEKQISLLFKQLKLSKEINKPCIFHVRNGKNEKDNAYRDFLDILKRDWLFESKKERRGILHSFSGNKEDARAALDLGLYLGINASFTYPKNGNLREIVKSAGIKNIVLETDCPYLPPQSMRGSRNSPLNIPEIYFEIAGYLCLNINRDWETIYNNSLSFIK